MPLISSVFCLHYQPIFSVCSLTPVAVESLLRPNYSIKFDDGCLYKTVIAEAMRDIPRLKIGLGNPDLKVHINITAHDIVSEGFWANFLECLQNTGVDPKDIVLELTEHFAIKDIERTQEVLTQCAGLGVQIYLDDFGCGYSNLDWLICLPISGLKFDRDMVQGYKTHVTATVFRHLCALSKDMGWKTTAEGIENIEDLSALKRLGFDQYQGYALCYPAPIGSWDILISHENIRPIR